jgi:hypothetical protein
MIDLLISTVLSSWVVYAVTTPGTSAQAVAAGLGATGIITAYTHKK